MERERHLKSKTKLALAVMLTFSLLGNGYLFVQYFRLQIEAGLALGLMDVFDRTLDRSLDEPDQARAFANYVEGHYVSGTVVRSETVLDKIIERRREQVVSELLRRADRFEAEP